MFQVMWLLLTNPSALFQLCIVDLHSDEPMSGANVTTTKKFTRDNAKISIYQVSGIRTHNILIFNHESPTKTKRPSLPLMIFVL